MGGSPGLVIKGGDSLSEGYEFESWHWTLDGHFFKLICCKICIVGLKRPKINEKAADDCPLKTISHNIEWNVPANCMKHARVNATKISMRLKLTIYSLSGPSSCNAC